MPWSRRVEAALCFAAQLHQDQERKGSGTPYLCHLLAVAALVGESGGSEDEFIAAVLHDAVEDQGGAPTLARVRGLFGDAVAEIVAGCTDTDATPKPPWRARKEAYIAHLAQASPSVLRVSCADKLHNARAIVADLRKQGDAAWSIFKGGKDGTLWYYRALTEEYRKRGAPAVLLEDLDRAVREMEALAAGGGKGIKATGSP